MSQINVNTITGKDGGSAVNFPHGITVTGVVTATQLNQNVTGDITVSGKVKVGDDDGSKSKSVKLGDDDDLTLYYDGRGGYVTSYIESDQMIIRPKTTPSDSYIDMLHGGSVRLFHGSNTRLSTSATGVGISGDLSVSGSLTVNGTTTTIDSATLSVEDKNIGIGSVTTPTNTTANGGGLTLFGGANGDKSFTWNESAQNNYWQLSGGQLFLDEGLNTRRMLKEEVDVNASTLNSSHHINLELGMVHYRTTALGATITPNVRYSSSKALNDAMAIGEGFTLTIITVVSNAAYLANGLSIDGNNNGQNSYVISTNWIGGSVPSDGGTSGVDIYTFNVIKTADKTFTIIANQTKTS
jgi:hypothetical protein